MRALLALSLLAPAHGGLPAFAELSVAPGRCLVADAEATLRWHDGDLGSPLGPSYVELYTSTVAIRPRYVGEDLPANAARIHRVPESDRANAFAYRTATVSEGHYFLFSYVREPPEERSPIVIRPAPYVLTVQHGAAPVGPTVVVTRPDLLAGSLGDALIHYSACDPTGTARVRLEAAIEPWSDYALLFDDLPAVESATVTWNTRGAAPGRWLVRATIHDACGHVFRSYARGFLEVRASLDPFDGGSPDAIVAGPLDATRGAPEVCMGRPDAAAAPDAGLAPGSGIDPIAEEGCDCSTSSAKTAKLWAVLLSLSAALLRRRRALVLLALLPGAALAEDPPAQDPTRPPPGDVLTYYGLRKLEFDANVSDEEKAREWEAFIKRSTEQMAYAKQAVVRWRDAGRVRAVESAQQLDLVVEASAADKIEAWTKVLKEFPKSPDAKTADKRIAFWRATEAKRLAQIAGEVEKSRATKVERINAWRTVLDFALAGPEKKNAEKKIAALQAQLVKEAEDLDRIPRVDVETKVSAWRDVLAGMPSAAQKRTAEQRIAFLQSKR